MQKSQYTVIFYFLFIWREKSDFLYNFAIIKLMKLFNLQ